MDKIEQAVERARVSKSPSPQLIDNRALQPDSRPQHQTGVDQNISEVALNPAHLLANRVVSHDGADVRSRPYDMLRIQILASMAQNGWKVLGVTSPTPGCGKTLTAINFALSIARQPEQSVVLVDADLQKPHVADCLGLAHQGGGTLDILENRGTLRNSIIPVRTGNHHLFVLPTTATRQSSALMGSRATRNLFQDIKRSFQSHIVIVDLPPMLTGDDVIAALPQVDCVLLIAAVGQTKVSEIEECNRHLESSHLVRLVINKSTEPNSMYYYY